MNSQRTSAAAALLAAIALAGAVVVAEDGNDAITRPSADRILSFSRPGTIAKVSIAEIREETDPKTQAKVEKLATIQAKLVEWDKVKKGQILVQLDTRVELIQLAQLKAQAEDNIRVEAQKAQLAQRKVDLKKTRDAYEKEVATLLELEHAQLDVTIGELSVKLAVFEKDQALLKYQQLKQDIASHLRLTSPIDGYVMAIAKNVGEAVDKGMDVLQLVQLDPLWIDVSIDRDSANQLAAGQKATVKFPVPEVPPLEGTPAAKVPTTAAGTIVHIAGMEDPASATVIVRVAVPNPEGRRAGEAVKVLFPQVKPPAKK